jgi:hypothetical protein
VLSSCSEDVVSNLPSDRVFETYGVLNSAADTQFVRVFPIRSRFEAYRDPSIDAVVTSSDLETGDRRVWRDSVLAFADGTYGYLFWSSFRALGGRAYELVVERSDGEHARAVVNVPDLPVVLPAPSDSSLEWTIRLTGAGARIHSVDVRHFLMYDHCLGQLTTLVVPIDGNVTHTARDVLFDVDLAGTYRDLVTILNRMGLYRSVFGILPFQMLLRLAVTEETWAPPGGIFDPEVLVEPGLLSNVASGFGMVGGGYYAEVVLFSPFTHLGRLESKLPAAAFEAAGFRTEIPEGGGGAWCSSTPRPLCAYTCRSATQQCYCDDISWHLVTCSEYWEGMCER